MDSGSSELNMFAPLVRLKPILLPTPQQTEAKGQTPRAACSASEPEPGAYMKYISAYETTNNSAESQ